MATSLFPAYYSDEEIDDELVVVSGEESDLKDNGTPLLWRNIYRAWGEILAAGPGGNLAAWRVIRQYGREIVPGLGVFHLMTNEENKSTYFYLLTEENDYEALDKLNNLFCILSAWQHMKRRYGFFHAAGVLYRDSACLFVGHSGAGKSTVCRLSAGLNHRSIHEDHVVVYPDADGGYKVTNRNLSQPPVPLRALFFLNQDKTDYLVPLPERRAAKGLVESCFDIARLLLHGPLLQATFRISADIARRIPAYELHFRKSARFWEKIAVELNR